MDLKITDRTIADFREIVSRIKRNADLIEFGNTIRPNGKERLTIIKDLAIELDEKLKKI